LAKLTVGDPAPETVDADRQGVVEFAILFDTQRNVTTANSVAVRLRSQFDRIRH
jgi:hypothetical protein